MKVFCDCVLLRYPKKSSDLRLSSIFSTAATRSTRCICHRQRSFRSPVGDSSAFFFALQRKIKVRRPQAVANNLPLLLVGQFSIHGYGFAVVTRWRLVCIPGFAGNRGFVPVKPGTTNSPPDCWNLFSSLHGQQKRQTAKRLSVFFGDPLETRTPDPLLKRQLLYRLS